MVALAVVAAAAAATSAAAAVRAAILNLYIVILNLVANTKLVPWLILMT